MMHPYRCDSCGCFLDPEHWKECDKCHQRKLKRVKRVERMQEPIKSEGQNYTLYSDGGQVDELI